MVVMFIATNARNGPQFIFSSLYLAVLRHRAATPRVLMFVIANRQGCVQFEGLSNQSNFIGLQISKDYYK